ncbi:hypothetical protein FBUS_04389 [Fasciolopsis buskii]|uniref:Uncharacterized protein n=1 Tax=Fasciolopsis buskii TaxID=27845 RepID=A0A8E0RTS8_9TREM|nr:hypothetical protein FBUS_04389 [Fasciolopsis buski]
MSSCILVGLFTPCYLCYMYKKAGENCAVPLIGGGPALLRARQRFRHQIRVSIRITPRNI